MSRPGGRALGRGLEALIPIPPDGIFSGIPEYVNVDQVEPSAQQMRRHFPADSLRDLAESIRLHGLLQPILVRRAGDRFQLVAGERRWRAAR
nr:ParB/RepB/Spo0J family partition protein [Candidatus Dormibacteraeota bacterium]